ncbi:hypothetical protein EBS02_11725 [bacterium]|nr:hypothetical protein [bacterium]
MNWYRSFLVKEETTRTGISKVEEVTIQKNRKAYHGIRFFRNTKDVKEPWLKKKKKKHPDKEKKMVWSFYLNVLEYFKYF